MAEASLQTPMSAFDASHKNNDLGTPNSTGLIRLTLKKPMGIVFEPMYDPHQPSVQRGVRICDLPRTGAAALSRKLQVGDELLQINDTTVSRMSFDEIMDFIIDADPEAVDLLFRRPRKETLQARHGMIKEATSLAVKWKDDAQVAPARSSGRSKREEEEETIQSSSVADSSYRSRKKRGKGRRGPYESESFLDMLIDTLCTNSACRDVLRRDDSFDDDEMTFNSQDESTYVTYEESLEPRHRRKKGGARKQKSGSESDTDNRKKQQHYTDDNTLETMDTKDLKTPESTAAPAVTLGLAPNPPPKKEPVVTAIPEVATLDEPNPAPIRDLEIDDQFDHAADVSVMESLGGPSLLIEKQRSQRKKVPQEIVDRFGLDYPTNFGASRSQTIQADPLKFYKYVVKQMLQENEPEKVRLLDKLLQKYDGREDHLVEKLSVRYEQLKASIPEGEAFTSAVQANKTSQEAEAIVETAKQRMTTPDEGFAPQWGDEKKEAGDDEDDGSGEYDEVDGTSPEVIAQVSELLNYVYGKTSVPGQIDRVSTIMRAYEGREGVLLELLETKALIKANKEKENAENLPAFLRNSTPTAKKNAIELSDMDMPAVTPMATHGLGMDDISSMSGVSSPAGADEDFDARRPSTTKTSAVAISTSGGSPKALLPPTTPMTVDGSKSMSGKKKKGFLGGLFGKKKGKSGRSKA